MSGKQISGRWKIPYRRGVLKAVAYDENGSIIATDTQSSFGDAARIVLKPDKTVMKADGLDMIFVEISMADRDGIRWQTPTTASRSPSPGQDAL